MSKADEEMVEAYDTVNKCLRTLCRKEYKGYSEFLKALVANNAKVPVTETTRLKNPAMEALLKCEVDKCKKAVTVLIQKIIVANTETIKKDTLKLKQAQDFQKKILKDSIRMDKRKLAALKKINLNQLSWQDLLELNKI